MIIQLINIVLDLAFKSSSFSPESMCLHHHITLSLLELWVLSFIIIK